MILARRFFGLPEEREKLAPAESGLLVVKIGPSHGILCCRHFTQAGRF
jgi:hypothetical protein